MIPDHTISLEFTGTRKTNRGISAFEETASTSNYTHCSSQILGLVDWIVQKDLYGQHAKS